MSNTVKGEKPEKPYTGYPLSAHPCGQWVKKIKGKIYYCGPWSDPDGALQKYRLNLDDWQAGRKPRPQPTTTEDTADGVRVHHIVNQFLAAKQKFRDNGELAPRTFAMYERCAKDFAKHFGRDRLVEDITPTDWQEYREHLLKDGKKGRDGKPVARSLVSLANELRAIRIMLNFAFDNEILDKPLRVKTLLKAPSKKNIRAESNAKPQRMLEAEELRQVLQAASVPMRAMILLGINGGCGQGDVAALPTNAVNLKTGWVGFARIKTAVQRRFPLWPETAEAIKAALAKRPTPKTEDLADRVFVTKYGAVFVRSTAAGFKFDSIALYFGKLFTKLKIKRPGLNFYCLRHGFETVAGDTEDQIATDFVMGHTPKSNDMGAVYRRKLFDARLHKLTDHVRVWLWPQGSEQAWLDSLPPPDENKTAE